MYFEVYIISRAQQQQQQQQQQSAAATTNCSTAYLLDMWYLES